MSPDKFVTIVVPANVATAISRVCKALGNDTDLMFTTPLSASGALPVTHYIASGKAYPRFVDNIKVGDDFWALIQERIAASGDTIPYTKTQVKTALTSVDISSEAPFVAMARLGLSIIPSAS